MMEPPAGYEEVAGTRLGYLRVGGRQLFALAQVLSGPLRGVPRGRVCRRMERLRIQIRRCDLWELRALKALRSVPSRAVQCCLISLEDLHVLCSSSWGPKTATPGDEIRQNGRATLSPEKECLPSMMKATFPSGLANLFPGTSRNLITGHSPASSLGYSSPSDSNPDQSSSSDTESDSSEVSVQNGRYRAAKIPTKRKSSVPRGRAREVALQCRNAEAESGESLESFSVCDPELEKEWPVPQNNGHSHLQEVVKDCHKEKAHKESPAELKETCEEDEDSQKSEEPLAALDASGSDCNVQLPDVEPRTQQFDRLVRQSKLWCYARGFRTDMRDLHPRISHKGKVASGAKKNGKLRHRKRKTSDGKMSVHHNKRVNSGPSHPCRPPFRFLDNFPSPASLVVGEDGDLCPAYSLKAMDPATLPRSHPLWDWHPGGSAIPLPPSLKFRSFPWGDCE
uniref:SKI/SNO/DAC domain-containing protein n=1 Tax=Xenopus tropicalis TaxID=8364 RepID=A0A6I8S2B1_XENTR